MITQLRFVASNAPSTNKWSRVSNNLDLSRSIHRTRLSDQWTTSTTCHTVPYAHTTSTKFCSRYRIERLIAFLRTSATQSKILSIYARLYICIPLRLSIKLASSTFEFQMTLLRYLLKSVQLKLKFEISIEREIQSKKLF